MTRRDLLVSLSALALARPGVRAQQPTAPFPVRTLNHVTLTTSNIQRSREFYQRMFGMPIQHEQGATFAILRVGSGPQFLALGGGGPNARPGISHFCMGIENFDADRVIKTLAQYGVMGRVRMRAEDNGGGGPTSPGGTPELTFTDPDGIVLQLQDVIYCGGAGKLGELCSPPKEGAAPPNAPLPVRSFSHVTVTVSNPQRAQEFYQRLFGMPIQAHQGALPVLGIGTGPAFVALAGGGANAKPNIGHFCMTVDNFNPDRITKTLTDLGVQGVRVRMRDEANGGAPGGTPELYFTDPDGIMVQLQDVKYCGGAGILGDVCR